MNRRLVTIAYQQGAQPNGSYSQAAGGHRHDLKGYYRLFNSKQEEMGVESLLLPHRTQTLRQIHGQSTVLILQDTTDMNLSSRIHCEGLGHVGTNQTGAISRGLKLHSSLAVAANGLPLGVLRLHGYAPESAKDKDPDRPIQEKDSYRWLEAYQNAVEAALQIPQTHVVCVCDREGDIFELFDLRRARQRKKVDLLVRASWDRCLEGTEEKLFEELGQTPCAKEATIAIPRQREHKAKPFESLHSPSDFPKEENFPSRQRFRPPLSVPSLARTVSSFEGSTSFRNSQNLSRCLSRRLECARENFRRVLECGNGACGVAAFL
ncbi:MAG: transposase DNA-binding-containing protein [Verrucomicrobia bacterium]|nr:transposase DNA-binding-containing protein [Verrucomicrobiota bacterium]